MRVIVIVATAVILAASALSGAPVQGELQIQVERRNALKANVLVGFSSQPDSKAPVRLWTTLELDTPSVDINSIVNKIREQGVLQVLLNAKLFGFTVKRAILDLQEKQLSLNTETMKWDQTIILSPESFTFVRPALQSLEKNPFYRDNLRRIRAEIELANRGLIGGQIADLLFEEKKLKDLVTDGGNFSAHYRQQGQDVRCEIYANPQGGIVSIQEFIGDELTMRLDNLMAEVDDAVLECLPLGVQFEELSTFDIAENGMIGMEVAESSDGSTMVQKVYKNSPTESQGVRVGDLILKVNGSELHGFDKEGVRQLLRGSPVARLEVFRPSDGTKREVTLQKVWALQQ